jgi:uncharacterized protein (DUF1330 family)
MYIHPKREQGLALLGRGLEGPVVMLNLLRFREVADYSESPVLAPEASISGAEAYQRYAAAVMPLLRKAGSKVLYRGEAGPALIGPGDEVWDLVLLVEHASVSAFMSFATDDNYLAIAGHRTAALLDSRLVPLQ